MSEKVPEGRKHFRCFCARKPLLAVYGLTSGGALVLHIKVFKQKRIYAELFIHEGSSISIRCRECFRLHNVKILGNRLLQEGELQAMDSINPDTIVG